VLALQTNFLRAMRDALLESWHMGPLEPCYAIVSVERHYSNKVKSVYITLWKVYLEHYIPNFVRISQVLHKTWHKRFG